MQLHRWLILVLAGAFGITGCMKSPPQAPFITDISDTKVEVTAVHSGDGLEFLGEWPNEGALLEQADAGCRINQKSPIGPLSWRCSVHDGYVCLQRTYLYACK